MSKIAFKCFVLAQKLSSLCFLKFEKIVIFIIKEKNFRFIFDI